MTRIELGDIVKCKYTGFTGTAVAKTEFINGCVQFGVAAKVGKENKLQDEIGIDEQSLVIVKKGPRHTDDEPSTGGANRIITRRNY